MTATSAGPWALRVIGLGKRFGPGCEFCLAETGPEVGRSTCPRCGTVVACAGVSFDLRPGRTLGIVGESGSGKTTVLRCLNGDLTPTEGIALLGSVGGGERDIFSVSAQERRQIRNFHLGMVYQSAREGLNLRISAGGNIAERLLAAEWREVAAIRRRAMTLLERMEVPRSRMDHPPSTFSGGMQQRVQIAKAIANGPSVVLLDEMTSGLDVSVQAGVLDLIQEIQRTERMAMVVVSHDLGVVRLLCERTIVMKNGRIVEAGLTDQILEDPQHPYTQLLVSSINT
ncbi:MAG: ATP-binding cassette domain-containing protein [Chloroflexota bacterium]|nr:ATP-binding cassette domain-containing protein [Dehalococcoidia bacterium]MDW8255232.1 ATP-binding cassette domain-containing protein [Chloroflexota bacterium]